MEIVVPVPSDVDSPKFRTSMGSVRYVPEDNVMIWTIRQFPGGKEYQMRAHFNLPSIQAPDAESKLPPIKVKFEIPYFTVSGLQVRLDCSIGAALLGGPTLNWQHNHVGLCKYSCCLQCKITADSVCFVDSRNLSGKNCNCS